MTLAPPEILTDTMGTDFGPYMTTVVKTVRQNWYKLMPPSVYSPISQQGKTSVEFSILRDGSVKGLMFSPSDALILKIGSNVVLGRAPMGSIVASTPFPPLPTQFSGQTLGLRFYFYYNIAVNGISISPCGDVQAPTSSTLKFSASGKGITDASVTWTVSGTGCSKSACGTISDTGLYTAPLDIPSPPTVIVEATSRTDMAVTAKSKVSIVQANSPH
jgi:hypothetical protein